MWLYRGDIHDSSSRGDVSAVKYFAAAMRRTAIYSTVLADAKSAITVLQQYSSPSGSRLEILRNAKVEREWRTILLFLELYTFVLRFTDDEEFLSGGRINSSHDNGSVISRTRDSALPLQDVKELTIFLKNLAFTMYYNTADLLDDGQPSGEGGLSTYFGARPSQAPISVLSPVRQERKSVSAKGALKPVAGMAFMYVRTVVTGVMRMIYERDSRRPFLPKDHWLMTSRFDMGGFLPAVVQEEERQHEITEEEEEEDNEEQYEADGLTDSLSDIMGMDRTRRARHLEDLQKNQQKAARQKMLAAVGPRLEVLQNMPFVLPFKTRVQIFREFVHRDLIRRRNGYVDADQWRMSVLHSNGRLGRNIEFGEHTLSRHHAKIRRDSIFEDAMEQFYELGEGLKEPIQITFIDKFGTVEAGIDGGGVTKEFLTSVTNQAFRSIGGPNLFVTNDQNLLYPNPSAIDERRDLLRQAGVHESDAVYRDTINELLKQYEFLGRVVGKCLYEGILVDISFAGFFLLKWASTAGSSSSGARESGYRANINDLRDLDESLYQGLLKLKNYSGNVEDFSLDFTIVDPITHPQPNNHNHIQTSRTITRDLMPNGSSIPVTNENRPLYVSYVARHRLLRQPFQQTQAFLRGLGTIIKPSWLSMFNQAELQTLIGGDASEIDVADLRKHTLYGGVYVIGDDGLEHPSVRHFWTVMHDLDDSDRRKVLKYVTSTPRAPLSGFGALLPRFSIRDAGDDERRLPSTSTCVNLLKMPRYSSVGVLREKLLYAVNSGAGFDLS